MKGPESETVCLSGKHKNEGETSSTKEKSAKGKEKKSAKRKQLSKGSSEDKYKQKDTEPIEKESKKRKSTDNENGIEINSKLPNEDNQDLQQNLNEIESGLQKRIECVPNDNSPRRNGFESESAVLNIVVKEEIIEEVSRSDQPSLL